MSKVWDKPITADTDWGGDASTDNLPVSGRQVQAWIKGNIKSDDAISLLIAKWLNEHTTKSITFWKGLPIDSGTLKWVDEHLTVVGGTGGSETPQDLPFIYDPVKKAWEFKGDFVVTGAITMFGSLSGFEPSTVTEAVEVDGETIVKTKNSQGQWQLTAIGRGGGTGGGISAAEVNILIENALKPYIKIETADDKYALISTVSGINSRLSAVETFFATEDSDTLINKWSEIVAFLNATEGDTLDNILATKANQSALDAAVASLTAEIGKKWTQNDAKISNWDSAYGWGNHANAGYAAKTYVEAELEKYVKLATAQSLEAQHNFVNGLQIGGLPITKSASANNTIYLDANLVVSGAITMFGSGSTTFPTIWANIPFNPEHLSWDGSQWNIIGGGGSGGLDTNAVNVLISEYLTQNSYATISDISSALVGYATQSWVGDNYLSKSGGTIEGVLELNSTNAARSIRFNTTSGSSWLFVNSGEWYVTNIGWGAEYNLIHSGNIGQYAYMSKRDSIPSGEDLANLQAGSYWVYQNLGAASAVKMSYSSLVVLGNSYYSPQMNISHNAQQAYIRGVYNTGTGNSVSDWHELAFTDSNVASATKLQTPRTIWGQSFDGTGNISGLLTNVDGIQGSTTNGGYIGDRNKGLGTTDGGSMIYNYSSSPITFHIAGFESMRIADGGNVAIGGTVAEAKLDVYGNVKASCYLTRGGSNEGLWQGSQYTSALGVNDVLVYGNTVALFDKVAIGRWTASATLHIGGDIIADGAITMFSQLSLKNVLDYDGLSLEQLAQIRPARFTWKDGRDSLVHAGGIADEVMRVLPEVVHRTKDDKLTMDYGSAGFFIATSLIKPVIDHERRIADLERENAELRQKVERLSA